MSEKEIIPKLLVVTGRQPTIHIILGIKLKDRRVREISQQTHFVVMRDYHAPYLRRDEAYQLIEHVNSQSVSDDEPPI